MKGYSYTVVDNNMAKSKGVGYYLSRLSVAISIVILTISLPLTVYSGFLTLGGSLALAWFVALLVFDAMLITYVVRQVKSKGVKKVVAGMRVYGCFNPSAKEEQYMPAQKTYFGIGVWGAMEPKTNVRVYHRRSVPSSHAFASTLQLHKSASRFISDRS